MPHTLADTAQRRNVTVDASALDDPVAGILVAIEQEDIPDRLRELAQELQIALRRRRRYFSRSVEPESLNHVSDEPGP